jgi:hypothetical protein
VRQTGYQPASPLRIPNDKFARGNPTLSFLPEFSPLDDTSELLLQPAANLMNLQAFCKRCCSLSKISKPVVQPIRHLSFALDSSSKTWSPKSRTTLAKARVNLRCVTLSDSIASTIEPAGSVRSIGYLASAHCTSLGQSDFQSLLHQLVAVHLKIALH